MCINLDITDMIKCENTLRTFTCSSSQALTQTPELFVGNVDELLEIMMKDAVNMTGKSVGNLTKEEKVSVVHTLDDKGFFLIKKSG